eukprot:1158773-Pelagomonas_calceolata.AAC.5
MGLAGGAQAHNSCWGCASQCFTMGASVPSTTVGSSVTKGYTGFETLRKNKGQVSLLASTQLIPITQQHARRGAGLTAHVLGSFLWPRQGANSSQIIHLLRSSQWAGQGTKRRASRVGTCSSGSSQAGAIPSPENSQMGRDNAHSFGENIEGRST